MSTRVHRTRPPFSAVCWIVGAGLLVCGCRSPLFTAGMNEPSRTKSAENKPDRDSNAVPAWKQDFDRYVAAHSRKTSPIRQASAEVPAAGSTDRHRTPARAVSGGSVSELLNRGHRAAAAGRTAEAQHAYRRVLVDDPDNAVAHHRLAIIADSRHDFDSADYHYHRALRTDRRNPDLLSDIGYSYLLQERYQESEDFLREAVRLSPEHHRAWSNLGLLFAVQGEYDRSLEAFRRSGSEREAQSRLAALFPHGRPPGRAARRQTEPAQTRDSVRAPQPVPTRNSPRAFGSTAFPAGRPVVSDPGRSSIQPGSESLTRQLQNAMQTAREQRSVSPRPFGSPGRQAASEMASDYAPRRTASLPDARINRAFADIDRRATSSRQSRFAQRVSVPSMRVNGASRHQPVEQVEQPVGVARGESAPRASRGERSPSSRSAVDRFSLATGHSRPRSISGTGVRRNPTSPETPALSQRPNPSPVIPATGADSSLLWPPSDSDTGGDALSGSPRRVVRQTGFNSGSRPNGTATSLTDEARRAARIGLSAGPGVVLPSADGTTARRLETARPATRSPATGSFRTDPSGTQFSRTSPPNRGSESTTRVPQNPFRGRAAQSPPRRLPSATTDRVPPSRQIFVPAPNQPTGYQMRSESPRRVDPPPYRPSRGLVPTRPRARSAAVPHQPPRYGYQPPPYHSRARAVSTGQTIQTGLTTEARRVNLPSAYRPQSYQPPSYRRQSRERTRRVSVGSYRPQITPGVSSSMTIGSGRRVSKQQGERSFAVPPSNTRSVIIPQQFLPR